MVVGRTTVVILSLLAAVAVIEATNPGLQFRLSTTGLNYVANQALGILAFFATGQPLPDVSGTETVIVGEVEYDITNMKVATFIRGTGDIQINPDGATLSIYEAGAAVTGTWKYKYWLLGFIPIEDDGTFDVYASQTSASVGISLRMDNFESGRLTVQTKGCTSTIGNLEVTFQGGASWLYNLFSDFVADIVKDAINGVLCDAAREAIDVFINDELQAIEAEIPIEGLGFLDYRLVGNPGFRPGTVETYHKGAFYSEINRVEPPFTAASMPDPSNHNRMATIYLSDYILNTLGFVLQSDDILDIEVTREDLPEEDRGILNTTCNVAICLGNIVPPEMAARYPGSSISLDIRSTSRPTFVSTPGALTGQFTGNLDFNILLEDGSKVFLISTLVAIDAAMTADITDEKITFEFTELTPDVTVIRSDIEEVPDSTLTLLFRVIMNTIVKPLLNEIGGEGLVLPDIEGAALIDPLLSFEQNTLVLQTDLELTLVPPARD